MIITNRLWTTHPKGGFNMSLTPDELVAIAPEIVGLVQEIVAALKKDENGKIVVTKEESARIRGKLLALAADLAKDAID